MRSVAKGDSNPLRFLKVPVFTAFIGTHCLSLETGTWLVQPERVAPGLSEITPFSGPPARPEALTYCRPKRPLGGDERAQSISDAERDQFRVEHSGKSLGGLRAASGRNRIGRSAMSGDGAGINFASLLPQRGAEVPQTLAARGVYDEQRRFCAAGEFNLGVPCAR